MTQDLNLVVDEAVRWAEVAATVRQHGVPGTGKRRESPAPIATRGAPAGQEEPVVAIALRSKEGTLTTAEADAVRDRIVAACKAAHGAELRA